MSLISQLINDDSHSFVAEQKKQQAAATKQSNEHAAILSSAAALCHKKKLKIFIMANYIFLCEIISSSRLICGYSFCIFLVCQSQDKTRKVSLISFLLLELKIL